jgi:hypothetical protein
LKSGAAQDDMIAGRESGDESLNVGVASGLCFFASLASETFLEPVMNFIPVE